MASPAQGVSAVMAVVYIVKCQWGIGMMAMPFMIMKAGVAAGVVQFVLSMVLTTDSIFRLRACRIELCRRQRLAAKTAAAVASTDEPLLPEQPSDTLLDYSGVVRHSLGLRAERVSLCAILASNFGSNIAFALFIGSNLHLFLSGAHLAEWQWIALCVPLWAAIACRRDVSFLAPIGALGLACALGFVAVILADAGRTLGWAGAAAWARAAPQIRPATLPIAVSISAFCNEGVVLMALSVESSMARRERFPAALVAALSLITLGYIVFALAGAALVDGDVVAPISDAFSHTPLHCAAAVLYALQLLPTYSIVYWLSYSAWEDALLRARGGGSGGHRRLRPRLVLPLRWAGIALSALVAVTIPKFGDFLALLGALANSLSIYIIPHLCWLRLMLVDAQPVAAPTKQPADAAAADAAGGDAAPAGYAARASRRMCALSACTLSLGAVLAVYGTYSSLHEMVTR
jgi:amino acid permease